MTAATVVLAVRTALDVAAARRLADYGDLDDAGVTRALEQVHMQRRGRADLPGHLRRIESLAAIVDDGDTVRLIEPTASSEPDRLRALFAVWPEAAADVVDWNGGGRCLLAARALAHEMPLPPRFARASVRALAERAAPAPADHPAPAEQVELECLRLMSGCDNAMRLPEAGAHAAARYRLWLRWLYCQGEIDTQARAAREARLREALHES